LVVSACCYGSNKAKLMSGVVCRGGIEMGSGRGRCRRRDTLIIRDGRSWLPVAM